MCVCEPSQGDILNLERNILDIQRNTSRTDPSYYLFPIGMHRICTELRVFTKTSTPFRSLKTICSKYLPVSITFLSF